MRGAEDEFCWWLRLLEEQIPTVVEKVGSPTPGGMSRGSLPV